MSEKITFKELVEKISKSTKQSEQTTNSFIHELADIIESGLEKGDKITISGFGKFELRWMDQRKGRNPQTGEEITIPGQNKVVFEPYKALREHVNKPFHHLEPKLLSESADGDSDKEELDRNESEFAAQSGKPEKQAGPDEIDDLIIERPSPVQSEAPETTRSSANPGASTPISKDTDSTIVSIPEPAQPDEKKTVTKTENASRFSWSYTASSAVILLAVFLLLFLMFWTDSSTEQAQTALMNQTPTEQAYPQLTPIPAPSAAADVPGADPPVIGVYSITAGETLWTIAERGYGDPYLWPIIYERNSEVIDNPNTILAGRSLSLPELSDPGNLT